jgi:uncharacterized Tic20 family protein
MSSLNAASALTQLPAGSLPATYVEQDEAQRGQAKVAHLFGILGILGTGINYYLKHKTAGQFVRDQMKEAFNFHVLVFAVAVVLSVAGMVAGMILGVLAMVFSLVSLALMVGAIALSVMNAMKAGKGEVARYPARINVLK